MCSLFTHLMSLKTAKVNRSEKDLVYLPVWDIQRPNSSTQVLFIRVARRHYSLG
jgi:hypothetical protein